MKMINKDTIQSYIDMSYAPMSYTLTPGTDSSCV